MTAWIGSPFSSASLKGLRTRQAAPSPLPKPEAFASYEKDFPSGDNALYNVNEFKKNPDDSTE